MGNIENRAGSKGGNNNEGGLGSKRAGIKGNVEKTGIRVSMGRLK